jgi:hypothetical protein
VTDVAGSPAEEYRRRRNAAQAALETLTREDRRLSNARLTVVAIAVLADPSGRGIPGHGRQA